MAVLAGRGFFRRKESDLVAILKEKGLNSRVVITSDTIGRKRFNPGNYSRPTCLVSKIITLNLRVK